jgi:hypothetical protein
MTTYGDQVYQYGGVPVGGAMTTGNVFFVHSVRANKTGNNGKKPSTAFATLDEATNACTANKNDIVYIMPNHAETIATATTWVPDVAGVQYIGVGLGADAPELTFSATGSKISVTGGNNLFQNIRFVAGISAIVTGVDVVSVNHVTFDGCTWDYGSAGLDFLWALRLDTATHCKVQNCHFIAENATTGANSAISIDASNFLQIRNNTITGDYANSCIESATTEAASKAIIIKNNDLYNDDTGSTYGGGIALRCAATGAISKNMVAWLCKAGESQAAIDPGSCVMFENFVGIAADQYGSRSLIGTETT